MDIELIKNILAGLTIAIGVIGPALAIGKIGSEAVKALGRNPEAASQIRTLTVLALAFAEAVAIYVLLISLIIKFV
ncbi:MAG: ATP synthase F0 subunit C [Patescibacteria group bacterium]|nr:ATP synthase F0 subunit C [Patescibacteria group bacterium]